MRIKSLLRKAGTALAGLLLASNIGCRSGLEYSHVSPRQNRNLEAEVELEAEPTASLSCQDFSRERKRLKFWQYPVNLIGGFCFMVGEHEASHVLAATLVGTKVKRVDFLGEYIAYVCYVPETMPDPFSLEYTFLSGAGPIGQRALIEAINYNLRKGNIDKGNQAFWATTSLLSRYYLITEALSGLKGIHGDGGDFSGVSGSTGVNPEIILGVVVGDALLNIRRIAKEFKVALGLGHYPVRSERKQSLDLVPTGNGLSAVYSRRF
jgi:hypothetical protein